MYILGYDWFQLSWEWYNTTDLWKRQNWIGNQETAYGLGIFVWVIIAIISVLFLIIMFCLIKVYFREVKEWIINLFKIKNKKNKKDKNKKNDELGGLKDLIGGVNNEG